MMDVSAQKAKSEDPLLAVLECNVEVDKQCHTLDFTAVGYLMWVFKGMG